MSPYKHILNTLLILIVLILSSCEEHAPSPEKSTRTILVYAIATNTLNGYDDDDIYEMSEAIATCDINNCRLLIYRVSYNNRTPKLMELHRDKNGKVVTTIHKTYDSTQKLSVSTQRFAQVLSDVRTVAPAREYGLILWSHSNGWAETKSGNISNISNRQPKYFGDDYGASMPIDSLSMAIPDNMFNFIWTDACYMGSIEIAYELRNDTKYFIGSPTEILSYGMPYDQNIPCFFENTADLKSACQNMFNFYDRLQGEYRSATISLIDCSKLNKIANLCLETNIKNKQISTSDLLCYNSSSNRFYFDFLQTYSKIATDEQYSKLQQALNQAVIYKAATPKILNTITIKPESFSGLSTYVMGSANSRNEKAYKALKWYKFLYE